MPRKKMTRLAGHSIGPKRQLILFDKYDRARHLRVESSSPRQRLAALLGCNESPAFPPAIPASAMPDPLTGRHYVCPRCSSVTQFIVRLPNWICPSCDHAQPADRAGELRPQSYAELLARKGESEQKGPD
jgi:hypothetical protein